MAVKFDPALSKLYYEWLSIAPEDQPPTLYRLLGLRTFEDNPNVIENAANRQMTHLRTFQSGKHSAESQKILNHVASARVTLLNPAKKEEYDKLLREQMRLEASESVLDEESASRHEELSMTLVGFLEAIQAEKEKEKQAKEKPGDFDPYQEWLAIAPEERPPTLYRLLGLRTLEDNRKVIKDVAARRTAQLREHVSGEHGGEARKLLAQVSSARMTLLDRKKKAEYDKLLRQQMKLKDEGSQPDEELSTSLAAFLGAVGAEKAKPAGPRKPPKQREAVASAGRDRKSMVVAVIGAGVLLLLVIGVLAWKFGGGKEEEQKPREIVNWLGVSGQESGTAPSAKQTEPPATKPNKPKSPSPSPLLDDRPAEQPVSVQFAEGEKELTIDLGNGVKMEFVLIPAGEFLMGSSDAKRELAVEQAKANKDEWAAERIPTEGPQHQVKISRPFYLGKYEVTQAQWQALMGNNPSEFKGPTNPVEKVNWGDIQQFLAKMNLEFEKKGMRFGLPSEAQWEYACRAGTATAFYFGENPALLAQYGWFDGNSGRKTHQVGQGQPNAWGLYDMHGNVWEWCSDWYAKDFYAQSPRVDPVGPPTGSHRVFRGGDWQSHPEHCRSALRRHGLPGTRHYTVGFRLAAKTKGGTTETTTTPLVILNFEETSGKLLDSSGNEHHGKVVGNVLYAQPGKFGKALGFDGKGGHVVIEGSEKFDFTKDFTWTAWVKTTKKNGPIAAFTKDGRVWCRGGKFFSLMSGRLCFYGCDVAYFRSDSDIITDDRWHHVAVNAKFGTAGSTAEVTHYVDGVKQAWDGGKSQCSLGKFPEDPSSVMTIGSSPGKYFHGLIDSLTIWDRALSPEEITALAAGKSLEPPKIAATEEPKEPVTPDRPEPTTPITRLPIPPTADRQKMLQQLDDVYDFAKRRTAAEKIQLAKELSDLGKKSQGGPAEKFLLFFKAMELAQSGGDAVLMLEAVDAMSAEFQVDALEGKQKALADFVKGSPGEEQTAKFIEAADPVIDEAIAAGRYDIAVNIAEAGYRLGRGAGNTELRKRTYDRRNSVKKSALQWKELTDAQNTLETNPDDPAANLVLGRWLCFERGDWEQGLPHLAKCSSPALKSVAEQELKSPPTTADTEVALADAWWNLAEQVEGKEKDALMSHAGQWYGKALEGLPEGFLKAKVTKRLDEVGEVRVVVEKIERPKVPTVPKELTIDLPGEVKMEFVLIPAGEFMMGSSEKEREWALKEAKARSYPHWLEVFPTEIQHRVKITKPFYLGKHEVTQAQWQAVMGDNPSKFKHPMNPVEQVSWEDCQSFLSKLNQRFGKTGMKFGLPTEAQWEYACRAGTSTPWAFGADSAVFGEYAWWKENSDENTHAVGKKKPNAFGLFDMHGNVWEWCADYYRADYYPHSPSNDPVGPPTGPTHVLRGGSHNCFPANSRSATRWKGSSTDKGPNYGFRVMCMPVEATIPVATSNLKKTPTRTFPVGKWVPLLTSPKELVGWKGVNEKVKYSDGVIELDKCGITYPIDAQDMVIRAKVKKVSGQNVALYLRYSADETGYAAWFNAGRSFGITKQVRIDNKMKYLDVKKHSTAESYDGGFELGFSTIGDVLTVFVNRRQIIQVRDSSLAHGQPRLSACKGTSLFRDVEIQILKK